jgi:regulator of replication initiation timing
VYEELEILKRFPSILNVPTALVAIATLITLPLVILKTVRENKKFKLETRKLNLEIAKLESEEGETKKPVENGNAIVKDKQDFLSRIYGNKKWVFGGSLFFLVISVLNLALKITSEDPVTRWAVFDIVYWMGLTTIYFLAFLKAVVEAVYDYYHK